MYTSGLTVELPMIALTQLLSCTEVMLLRIKLIGGKYINMQILDDTVILFVS